jgi:hypothetical protein
MRAQDTMNAADDDDADTMSSDDSMSSNNHLNFVNESDSQNLSEQELCQSVLAVQQKLRRLEDQSDASRKKAKLCRARRLLRSRQFEALCLALRRNDATAASTELDCYNFPSGYGKRLGEALQGNTRVTMLGVNLDKLIPLQERFHDTNEIVSFVTPLLHFMRTSNALRSVSVSSWHPFVISNLRIDQFVAKLMFTALFESQGAIEEMTFRCFAPITLFCNGMPSYTALKTLDIDFGDESSHEERMDIEAAFRLATSLESLSVATQDVHLATSVLTGLKSTSCKLHELKLCGRCDTLAYWVALSEYTHATQYLQHLVLQSHELTSEHVAGVHIMEALLNCLADQSTVTKLSLLSCIMDTDAIRVLKRFLRARKKDAISGISCLCTLVFDEVEMGDEWSGPLFASMFWTEQVTVPYIRSLTLDPVDIGGPGFVQALARNAHHVDLTSLKLRLLDHYDCKDVARYISATLSLDTLELKGIQNLYPILCSLQSNGTLQRVTLDDETSENELRLVNSFCLRNELLGPTLLDLADDNNAELESLASHCTTCLLPTLLQSAKHITAMRASIILSTLRALGESAGPINGKAHGK